MEIRASAEERQRALHINEEDRIRRARIADEEHDRSLHHKREKMKLEHEAQQYEDERQQRLTNLLNERHDAVLRRTEERKLREMEMREAMLEQRTNAREIERQNAHQQQRERVQDSHLHQQVLARISAEAQYYSAAPNARGGDADVEMKGNEAAHIQHDDYIDDGHGDHYNELKDDDEYM